MINQKELVPIQQKFRKGEKNTENKNLGRTGLHYALHADSNLLVIIGF